MSSEGCSFCAMPGASNQVIYQGQTVVCCIRCLRRFTKKIRRAQRDLDYRLRLIQKCIQRQTKNPAFIDYRQFEGFPQGT